MPLGPSQSPKNAGRIFGVAALVAAIVASGVGCTSSSTHNSTEPTPAKCGVSLTMSPSSMGANGGSGSVAVSAQPECGWQAAASANWITSLTPSSGQGSGQVQFVVAANPDSAARQADITINGETARVRQDAAPCRIELSTRESSVESGGGTVTISVTAAAGCTWTASSDASWVTVASGATGSGNGTIRLQVGANAGDGRSGSVTVAGQAITVRQAGPSSPPPCSSSLSLTVQQVPTSGGTHTVAVRAAAGCSWTAVSNVPWITVSGGAAAAGDNTVTYVVSANPDTAPRTGTLNIAQNAFTVLQAAAGPACAYTLNPTSRAFPVGGGPGSIAVATTANCAWTATADQSWVTVTSGGTGSGNGTVNFTVAGNSASAREAHINVAGQTFTVTQAAPTVCAYSLNPTSRSFGAAGGTGTISVSTSGGCDWTASPTESWVTIDSGGNGSGNGTVNFRVATNTGAARGADVTIAGQTFAISQAAGAPVCTYSIDPTSRAFAAGGGSGTISVSAPGGCNWSAGSDQSWLTIAGSGNGSGNGTVNFNVGSNGGGAREAHVTIAGQVFTVTQAAAAPVCSYSINPIGQSIAASGATGSSIAVMAPNGCAWTAQSHANWLTITSGASGSGNGTVQFNAQSNNGNNMRTGTMTVASQTFTATQAAPCSYSINPNNRDFSEDGGTGTVTVTTAAGCTWTAVSNDSWITITSGASGSGNGTVGYRVASNSGNRRRGTMTIAGRTFDVDQDRN